MAKGLSSGYLPISATAVSRDIVDVLRASDGVQAAALTLVAACVDSANRSVSMPAELAEALRARLP